LPNYRNAFDLTIEEQDEVQERVEHILFFLSNQGIIKEYDSNRLDYIFSNNENY
jgi:hypothetical protein